MTVYRYLATSVRRIVAALDAGLTELLRPRADRVPDWLDEAASRGEHRSVALGDYHHTSAVPLTAEDDPAGILPLLPAGSPEVPAGVSAGLTATVPPAGHSTVGRRKKASVAVDPMHAAAAADRRIAAHFISRNK